MAAARGDSATRDGHNPEVAVLSDSGESCEAEWVIGGSIRHHIFGGSAENMGCMNPMVTVFHKQNNAVIEQCSYQRWNGLD